jgi:hypothetical protein
MMGEAAKPQGSETEDFQEFGYYTDPLTGKKKFGVLPASKHKVVNEITKDENKYGFRWIDASGNARYDSNFDVTDVHDLDDV